MTTTLSQQELVAERMYELFRTGNMGRKKFIYNFRNLAKEKDNISMYYLYWLLLQNHDDNEYIISLLHDAIKYLI